MVAVAVDQASTEIGRRQAPKFPIPIPLRPVLASRDFGNPDLAGDEENTPGCPGIGEYGFWRQQAACQAGRGQRRGRPPAPAGLWAKQLLKTQMARAHWRPLRHGGASLRAHAEAEAPFHVAQ